jgi:hypothetical protein
VRYESVPELLAVVKAPPTHFDILEGKEVVVNLMAFNSYGSYSRVADAAGVMSSFEIKRDRVHGSAHAIGALSLPPHSSFLCAHFVSFSFSFVVAHYLNSKLAVLVILPKS